MPPKDSRNVSKDGDCNFCQTSAEEDTTELVGEHLATVKTKRGFSRLEWQ